MEIKFSKQINTIFGYAAEEAMRTGSYSIGPDHIMLGILRHSDNEACQRIKEDGVDLSEMKNILDSILCKNSSIPYTEEDLVHLSSEAQGMMNLAALDATSRDDAEIDVLHILSAICKVSCISREYLKSNGIDPSMFNRKKKDSPKVIHITIRESEFYS